MYRKSNDPKLDRLGKASSQWILSVASSRKLTAAKLAKLGADALANVLAEEASRNSTLKRQLTIMLAADDGPEAVAREVRKRINTIARSVSFVDWHKIPNLRRDLELQRSVIVDQIAPANPQLAIELMWRFLDLSEPCMERCDDSNGVISGVFRNAVESLGEIAADASTSPETLADATYDRLQRNHYGIYDELIYATYPALDEAGVKRLKEHVTTWYEDARRASTSRDFDTIKAEICLQALADAEGDVDAYINAHDEKSFHNPVFAARIANRLTAAGRAEEALAHLENAIPERDFGLIEWNDAKIVALLAIGNTPAAQERRWQMFQRTLDDRYLRDYLKVLPDFDDVEAEDRALTWVENAGDIHRALAFLTYWPALDRASRLVLNRFSEMDGNAYYILSPVAENLEGKYPLSAVLLRRALIEATLNGAKSKRYKHAVRHMLEIESLDRQIADYGDHEPNDAFVSRLEQKHSRKHGFWGLLDRAK